MLTNDAFALQQRACFSFAVLTERFIKKLLKEGRKHNGLWWWTMDEMVVSTLQW